MHLATPGQPLDIFAGDWNDLQSMLAEWRAGRLKFDSALLNSVPRFSIAYIKNNSTTDVAVGEIMGLGNPIISPTDDLEQFKANAGFIGATPTTASHAGKFAVMIEPAEKNGGYGRGVIAGDVRVKLSITATGDTAAEVTDNNSTFLTTGSGGSARILWKSSGTGSVDKWGIVRLGDAPRTEAYHFSLATNGTGDIANNAFLDLPMDSPSSGGSTTGYNKNINSNGSTPTTQLVFVAIDGLYYFSLNLAADWGGTPPALQRAKACFVPVGDTTGASAVELPFASEAVRAATETAGAMGNISGMVQLAAGAGIAFKNTSGGNARFAILSFSIVKVGDYVNIAY